MSDRVNSTLGLAGTSTESTSPGFSSDKPGSLLSGLSGSSSSKAPAIYGPSARDIARQARNSRGWGQKYDPPLAGADGRDAYRRICDDLEAESRQLDAFVVDGVLSDEASGIVAEIQNLLEALYDCPFGEGESLKMAVVSIQSQLNNAEWTRRHVNFLRAAIRHLRVRWIVNEQTAQEVNEMIQEHELDPFRGTISEPDGLARYRIERIQP